MPDIAESFIARWKRSSASERANYALFLSELCDLMEVPRPDPSTSDEDANTYVIDKAVVFKELDGSSTTNFIDLYRRNCFVLEAKQGSNPQSVSPANSLPAARRLKRGTAVRGTHGWDEAMLAARGQAERYAKALPASEGWPPFLIVVDVGHSIELYADFSLTGKAYLPFPDPRTFRVLLDQLALPSIQERLRALWLDPLSLDPARETAKVTREVAGKLAALARNLELQHSPKAVRRVSDPLHLHLVCGGCSSVARARLAQSPPKPSRGCRQLSTDGRSALANHERRRVLPHTPQPYPQIQRRTLRIHNGLTTRP